MYVLHDNGRKLFTSPTDCTPMQRFVYVLARNHHEDDVDSNPHGFDDATRFNNNISGL